MQLRDYQIDIISRVKAAFKAGRKAPLVVMPTGGGKTAVAVEMARLSCLQGNRAVWLTHRQELADQTVETARRLGLTAGTIGASLRGGNKNAQFVVCMVQTLLSRGAPDGDVCFVDECQHYSQNQASAIAKRYPYRVGFTATPQRGDGAPMGDVFDDLVVGPSMSEFISRGFLVPCEVITPQKPVQGLAMPPLRAYERYCKGRKTLVFATNIKAAEEYLKTFQDAGIKADIVTGETPDVQRKKILSAIKSSLDVVVNVGVLTEGTDIPEVSAIILARGCGTVGLFIQITGRALRPCAGKKNAVLVDLAGSVHIHGPPDEDRIFSLDGIGIQRASEKEFRFCQVCGSILDKSSNTCIVCGWRAAETELPRITHDPMVKYAFKRAQDIASKIRDLHRWYRVAEQRGYSPKWAEVRWKVVYGAYPPADVRKAALDDNDDRGTQ